MYTYYPDFGFNLNQGNAASHISAYHSNTLIYPLLHITDKRMIVLQIVLHILSNILNISWPIILLIYVYKRLTKKRPERTQTEDKRHVYTHLIRSQSHNHKKDGQRALNIGSMKPQCRMQVNKQFHSDPNPMISMDRCWMTSHLNASYTDDTTDDHFRRTDGWRHNWWPH